MSTPTIQETKHGQQEGAEVSAVVHQVTKCLTEAQSEWVDGKHEEFSYEAGAKSHICLELHRGSNRFNNVVNEPTLHRSSVNQHPTSEPVWAKPGLTVKIVHAH